MTFLIIEGERYALSLGETTLGGTEDELLRQSPLAALPPFAVVSSEGETSTIRALSPKVPVTLQGKPLDGRPRALRHGDCVTAGGLSVHVGDLDKARRTDHVNGVTDTEAARGASLPTNDPTAATGGQLMALSDGRQYAIPATGLLIGRDPDCDIVLVSPKVSRRHARLSPCLLGYALSDASTNGVVVNGGRLEGQCVLSQGDVIGIGEEAFRFSADAATYEPDPSVFAAPPVALMAPEPISEPSGPSTEPIAVRQPMERAARPTNPLLATLEVLGGSLPPGTIFRVERPVVQIGRGAQSDVRLEDESVSGTHATLLQRDRGWQILDLGSRNGTYVEGQRVTECLLQGVCELQLGMITLLFRPIRSAAADTSGTLGLIGITHSHSGKRR